MNDKEKWYRFCMLCKYAYVRKEDANIYCSIPEDHCPHKNEIEEAEKKEK